MRIRHGETFSIPVKPSFTIGEIKTQIQSLKEISMEDLVLKLNKDILQNDMTLSVEQIENSFLWLTYEERKISVHI